MAGGTAVRNESMKRLSRNSGIDLHQAGARPRKLRDIIRSYAHIGHKEVRSLALARAESKAGLKVKGGIKR
jgi:hypothetical protein